MRGGLVARITLTLGLVIAAGEPAVGAMAWPSDPGASEVDRTKDSATGWRPTAEQVAAMHKTADDYFSARDGGGAAVAYALLAEANQRDQSLEQFSTAVQRFNVIAGPGRQRKAAAVTWSKDPARAPARGVYAAVDDVSQFANIDRHCGYLMLYQPSSGGPLRVMREEANYLDNASVRKIEEQHSRAEVDRIWAQLSRQCPSHAATPAALPEQSGSPVGYRTVEEALNDLHGKPSVTFSSRNGWTIANDAAALTVWSFVPAGDPAYPAVVRRHVVPRGTAFGIEVAVLCQSTKQACDNLVRQFQQGDTRKPAAPQ